jgi:hypothetical protein
MSLVNLASKTLEEIAPDADTIKRLLSAAARNLQDARVAVLSMENRFDVAYKAIMQLANAALQANGFRTLTSVPGHHRTMIQTLTLTIGLDQDTVIVLDALRKQRNVADYSGDLVPENTAAECVAMAEMLMQRVTAWLMETKPGLLAD